MITLASLDDLHRSRNRATPKRTSCGPLDRASTIDLIWRGAFLHRFTWGRFDAFGTAAYWADQASRTASQSSFGEPLLETVAFCMLGGYGITYEMNAAAFNMLRARGLLDASPPPQAPEIERVLRTPVVLPDRRTARYRFPKQRAMRLANSLALLANLDTARAAVDLRDALDRFPGIGPKTASWIVRNHTGSDAVAIVDIHLRRAGITAGFFSESWRLPRDYPRFEAAFLGFADCASVPASQLDLVIWEQMRTYTRLRSRTLPEQL